MKPIKLALFVLLLPGILIVGWAHICGTNSNSLLPVTGLIYDALGAVVVLAGEWSRLRSVFLPTEKISRIQSARDELFDSEVVQAGHPGYRDLIEIAENNFDITQEPDCLTFGEGSSGAVLQTSTTTYIHGYTKSGEFSEYELDTDSNTYKQTLGSEEYTDVGKIASVPLFDARISQEILRLERNAVQTPLRFGVTFLLFGFITQILSYVV